MECRTQSRDSPPTTPSRVFSLSGLPPMPTAVFVPTFSLFVYGSDSSAAVHILLPPQVTPVAQVWQAWLGMGESLAASAESVQIQIPPNQTSYLYKPPSSTPAVFMALFGSEEYQEIQTLVPDLPTPTTGGKFGIQRDRERGDGQLHSPQRCHG